MSFLAPLFLIGLGLLAIPIWLHRLQTDDPVREPFASTMLLEASQKRVHVRKQLQHLLLMLLRLLFIALLVIAFARPSFITDIFVQPDFTNRMHVLVIDRTASTSAPSVFGELQSSAGDVVRSMEEGDLAQVFAFGPVLESVAEVSFNKSDLIQQIDEVNAGETSGNFGDLMGGLSRLDWSQSYDYQVHIFSDFQQSALPDRYADMVPDLPSNAQVSFNFYGSESGSNQNWAIESVRQEGQGLRVNVTGWNTPERELSLAVRVGEEPDSDYVVQVPESGKGSVFISQLEYASGINQVTIEIQQDDLLASDNRFHIVVDRSPPEPVLLLTENPFSPSANYLSAVMSSIGRGAAYGSSRTLSGAAVGGAFGGEYRAETISLSEFDPRTLERYSWVLVDDLGDISDSVADAISGYLESGGAVFAGLGDAAASREEIPVSGHVVLPEAISNDNRFMSVAQVTRSHEIMNGLEGWSDLRVSRSLNLDVQETDNVLVSLDNGNPLVIEQRHQSGKLILFSSSLDNQWNNLPVKPLYVSLMAKMADYVSGSSSVRSQMYSGETLSLIEMVGGAGQLIDPAGNAVLELGNTRQPGVQVLDKTGFYQLFSVLGESSIGVNTNSAESDPTPIDEAEFLRWQQTLAGQSDNLEEGSAVELSALSQTPNREFWVFVLLAGALILLSESLFANWKLVPRAAN